MKVQAIRRENETRAVSKAVAANQKSVDQLAMNSGTWRVEGVPGLYVRCRARAKSFFIQRRVKGHLVKQTLGALTVKAAREKAMKSWSGLKAKPAGDAVTLEAAFESYLIDKPLAAATVKNYRFNLEHHLDGWKGRSLHDIGGDRPGVRALQRQVREHHGAAASNQVLRLLSAVYKWARREDPELPEPPTVAVQVDSIPARDWGYSPEQLKAWGAAVQKLTPIKRAWWKVALFTGARKGSIEALRWQDVDFTAKVILFTVTKGDRPYSVPMADMLADLLARYRDSGDVPPSPWVFPSNIRDNHIVDVRDDQRGVGPAHRLRHSFRTTLAQLGAPPDSARMLMGHSMRGDISTGYISAPLVVESLRPITNAVAERYGEILKLVK